MVRPLQIVVTDPIVSRFESLFRQLGTRHNWKFVASLDPHEQSRQIAEADVLVCARLSDQDAQRCTAGLVHVTGAGTDRVALKYLPESTQVATTSHHERSIAEYVVMAILAHERRLLSITRELTEGTWRTLATDPNISLFRTVNDLTVGFIGMGAIGQHTLSAVTALGAKAVAVRRNPSEPSTDNQNLHWVKSMEHLPELLECSDVVVLCLPLTDATRDLIGATELSMMRSDALLVNVARGPIVNAPALIDVLDQQLIGGAALDVWWDAPTGTVAPALTQRLAAHPLVIATPHYSGHSRETFLSRVKEICSNINGFASVAEQRKGLNSPEVASTP